MENIIRKIRERYPVTDDALQVLLSSMSVKIYPKNTLLVQSGIVDYNVYFIEQGITRSFFMHNETETTTWFSQEGDVTFGMGSLYYNQPSAECVETLERSEFYVIPISRLNELYETYIDIANWGRVIHQQGYNQLSHIFVDRLQLSPKERYDRFMEYFPGVINRTKLRYIAEFLGISIYTLSRIRSQKN